MKHKLEDETINGTDVEVDLQLVMVELSGGQRGVFIGSPAVADMPKINASKIVNIWFSNIQRIPADMSVPDLMSMINDQVAEQTAHIEQGQHTLQ